MGLHHIDAALRRIVAIVQQLSSLVVRTRPALGKAGLGELIAGGIARFHRDFQLTAPVTVDNPAGELPLETNTEAFEEVLSKILINAWEAYDRPAGEPRPISVHTRVIERAGSGRFAEIRVDDEGHGLDAEIRHQIFEPFVSSKHTVGVGMGLTVARHALRNLGGEVSVADRAGGGASSVLRHPLERHAPLDDAEAEALARDPGTPV